MAESKYQIKLKLADGREISAGEFTVPHGKSAYEHAKEGGYAGTEEEFANKMASGGGGGYAFAKIVDGVLRVENSDGSSIFGSVDDNNNITLSGLAAGTYTLKYEQTDGSTTEIGSVVVSSGTTADPEPEPTYTNLFNPDTATLNKRWTSSGNWDKDQAGHFVSDYIPVTLSTDTSNPTIMHFRGATYTGNANICFYTASKSLIASSTASSNGQGMQVSTTSVTTDDNGDYQINLGYKNGTFDSAWTSGVAYMKVGLRISDEIITAADIQDVIITVNELITS